jgi:hypothetical protein
LQVDTFGPLALVTSGDSYSMDQKTQDAAATQEDKASGLWLFSVFSNTVNVLGTLPFISVYDTVSATKKGC